MELSIFASIVMVVFASLAVSLGIEAVRQKLTNPEFRFGSLFRGWRKTSRLRTNKAEPLPRAYQATERQLKAAEKSIQLLQEAGDEELETAMDEIRRNIKAEIQSKEVFDGTSDRLQKMIEATEL